MCSLGSNNESRAYTSQLYFMNMYVEIFFVLLTLHNIK